MKIENFSELTDFLCNEYIKMLESFGVEINSKKIISYAEKTLVKYIKLYDKPLYRRVKRELALDEAIDTMPHSKMWKFFHKELWEKINNCSKNSEENEEITKESKPDTIKTSLVPVVIKSVSVNPEDEF